VPLLLRAVGASDRCPETASRNEHIAEVGRQRCFEGAAERAAIDRGRDAGLVAADVGAPTVCSARGVEGDVAARLPDDSQELPLLARRPAGDARAGRWAADVCRAG